MIRRAALLTLLFPSVALAQPQEHPPEAALPVEPIATAYDAPADCPTSDSFFREITGRTSRARTARSGEKARVVHVALVADQAGFVGRLLIEDGGTWSSAREVKGATCREVVEALGLIAALAVDPKASTTVRNVEEAPRAVETPPLPPPRQPEAPPVKSGEVATTRFGFGAQGEGSFVADSVLAIRVFGEVDFRQDATLLSPTIRLAVGRSFDVDRKPRVGSATLHYTTGAIDGCPLRVRLMGSAGVALRPVCAGFSLGVLDAEGAGVGGARSRSRPWSTIDAHARATWEPVRWLAFGFEGGVLATLFREDFFFEPTVPIYRAPLFAGFLRFGAAVRFP